MVLTSEPSIEGCRAQGEEIYAAPPPFHLVFKRAQGEEINAAPPPSHLVFKTNVKLL
jgi:hypothetical protein